MNWVAEAGHLPTTGPNLLRDLPDRLVRRGTAIHSCSRVRQHLGAELRGPEHDGAAAEDTRSDRALQVVRTRGERHARGLRRRSQAVLGDRDEQQIEEEALVGARLPSGYQEKEELGEA